MSDIVNLRQVRKAKRRSDAANDAAANRFLHGRSRAERAEGAMRADQARRLLDGARRNKRTDGKAVDEGG